MNFQNPMNVMAQGSMLAQGTQRDNFRTAIILRLSQQQKPVMGWQAQVRPDDRVDAISQLVRCSRAVKQNTAMMEIINESMNIEANAFMKSPSRERYVQEINGRIALLTDSNNKAMANNINTPQSMNMATTHASMSGQSTVPPTMINQIPNTFPQGFPPQLQKPMQVSPIPLQPQSSSMTAPTMAAALSQQADQQALAQNNLNSQQLASKLTPAENAQIENLSCRLMQNASQAQKEAIYTHFQNLPPGQRQELERNNIEPLSFHFRQKAIQAFLLHKQQQQQQQQMMQLGGRSVINQDPNARLRNVAGLPQRPNNQARGPQSSVGFSGTQSVDATEFAGQQAEALHLQGEGHVVVPASHNPNTSRGGVGPGGFGNLIQPGQGGMLRPGMVNQSMLGPGMHIGPRGQISNSSAQAGNVMQTAGQTAEQMARFPPGQRPGQLTGQMGGLQASQTTQQSPAMPTLTSSMVPPDQPAVTTPQQKHPQASQALGQGSAQANQPAMIQHQGSNANLAQFVGTNPTSQTSHIPPSILAKLQDMSQPQRNHLVKQYMSNNPNKNMIAKLTGQQGIGNQMPTHMLGDNSKVSTNMTGAVATPGLPMNSRDNMGLRGPAGTAVATSTERQDSKAESLPLSLLQQMDQVKFPPSYLQRPDSVPDNVMTWGQLKEFARENRSRLNISIDTLMHLQAVHYQRMQNNAAMSGFGAGQSQVGQASQGNGVAPPAPMFANPQQQPNRPPQRPLMAGFPMPSADQIRHVRMQLGVNYQKLSDQQVCALIISKQQQQKTEMENQRLSQEQTLRQANAKPAMASAVRNVSTPQPQRLHQPPQQPRQGTQQNSGTHPMRPQSTGKVTGPNQNPPFAAPSHNQMPRGIKRPANDDDSAIKMNEQNQQLPSDRTPSVQQSRSSQGFDITQEGFAKLNPHQQMQLRERMRAHREAQMQIQQPQTNNGPTTNEQANISSISSTDQQRKRRYNEICTELATSMPKRPPLSLSPEERQQIEGRIRSNANLFTMLDQLFPLYLHMSQPAAQQQLKPMLTYYLLLKQQAAVASGQKEHYTLRFQEVQQLIAPLSMFAQKALKARQALAEQRQANLAGAVGAFGQGNQAKAANLQAMSDDQRRLIQQQKQQQMNHELQQQQQQQQAREQHQRQQQHQHFLAQQEYQRMQKQHNEQQARRSQQKLQEQKQQQQREQEQHQKKQRDQQKQPTPKTQNKQTQKQRQAQQQREKSSKPPSAPIDPKPPFALSPHRVPQYADSHTAPKKLELPPSKKTKTSQPAEKASTSSGAVVATSADTATAPSPMSNGKTVSPAARRALIQDAKKAADGKPQFRCAVIECEFRTFQSQAELDRHTNDVHAKIEDPFGFVMDCMAKALGLNKDGSLKAAIAAAPDVKNSIKSKTQPGVALASVSNSPNIKHEVSTPAAEGTPMARVTTQPIMKSSPAMMHLKTPQPGSIPLTPKSTPGKASAALAQKSTAETTLPTPAPESSSDEAQTPSPWSKSTLQPETLAQCFEGLEYLWGNSILSSPKELSSPALTPTSKTSDSSKPGAAREKAEGEKGTSVEAAEAEDGKEDTLDMANGKAAVMSTSISDYDSILFDLDSAGVPTTLTDADALDDLCSLGLFADDDIFDFGASDGVTAASASASASAGKASAGTKNVVTGSNGDDVATDTHKMQQLLSMEWDQVIGANAGLEMDLPGFDVKSTDMWASL